MDWFLYDNGLRHERVKESLKNNEREILACNVRFKEGHINI